MNRHLHLVVGAKQERRLIEEDVVASVGVPAHCAHAMPRQRRSQKKKRQANKLNGQRDARTMTRYQVHPFVKRRVELRDDVLLPIVVAHGEQVLCFVQRVL